MTTEFFTFPNLAQFRHRHPQKVEHGFDKIQHLHRVHKCAVAGSDDNMQELECHKATHKRGLRQWKTGYCERESQVWQAGVLSAKLSTCAGKMSL